jgi:protein transport protein SEC31
MSRTTKHSGAIKTVQFNHSKHDLLATAGAKGELFIYDLNNIANPFRLGGGAARADDFECLDWNKGSKVPHILATGSSGGFVTIWDVRQKKENLTLNNYGRKPVSAVAWDPDVATKLMTAIPNDQDPLILMWDLRNSSAPERILRGHELGVLSLSWCLQDSSLLLSCGKDNRTVAWNPHTGESYGDFPVVTNWTFQTRWNPHNPGLLATASFDGKIAVQTIQNTNSKNEEKTTAQQALEGEDFFNQVQDQPQHVSFSLPKAPKWMERPAGVSFGFGGKLVRLATDPASRKSTVSIETFAVDSAVTESSKKFEESLKGGDLASICESKISAATNEEEKADWQVIETLNAGKSRKKLREYLGFADETEVAQKTDDLTVNGDAEKPKEEDDSNFFGNSDNADGEDGDNFLADLAATKGAKTNQPFHIFSGEESDADKNITRALMLGNFESALDVCLKDDRMSDAFMIAICGGQKCMDKVQTAYLKQKAKGPNYLRLLASIVGKNLWDVVHNADLSNWKEVMATLCTFADETEFSDLCEALGDRLEESLSDATDKGTLRRDASFCFLAGSKLEKVVAIWAQELQEKESAGLEASEGETSFSVHARTLQDFIEKVTVFRQVVGFQDPDRQASENYKLAPLYAKYTEYADILASHGQLQVAEKYLDLLPSKYSGAEVAQQRVKLANRSKPVVPQVQRQPAAAARAAVPMASYPAASTPTPLAAGNPYAPSGGIMSTPAPAGVANTYAPPGAAQPAAMSNPYAPPTQAYAPQGYQPQQNSAYGQPGPYGAPAAPMAPPRGMTPSALPPPPKKGETQQWNDLPEGFSKPVQPSRRGTPGMATMSSPFPNAPIMSPPPAPGSAYGQQPAAALPPPPPKAGQMPSRVMSPASGPPQIQRPMSAASNAYTPAPGQQSSASTLPPQQAPPLGRGPSAYNLPPTATANGPASNRYAPAPGSQPTPAAGGLPPPRQVAPQPTPYGSAAPSPYAPAASAYGARPPVAPYGQAPTQSQPPAPQAVAPPPQGPPRGPPQGPPRAAAPPQAMLPQATPPPAAAPQQLPSRPTTAQSQRSAPAAAKYRKSSIPSNPILDD